MMILSQPLLAAEVPSLEKLELDLASNDLGTYQRAAQGIAALGPAAIPAIPVLVQTLKQDQHRIGFATHDVARVLGKLGAPALPAVLEAFHSPDVEMRLGAIDALGELGPVARPTVPELLELLRHPNSDHRVAPAAAEALGKIGAVQPLLDALNGKDPALNQTYVIQGLGASGAKAAPAVPRLIDLLRSSDTVTQMSAAQALGKIGPPARAAVPDLARLAGSDLNFVRHAAGQALLTMGVPEAAQAAEPYRLHEERVKAFFQFMGHFIDHPTWAAWIGALLALLFGLGLTLRKPPSPLQWPLAATSLVWLIYSVWETMWQQARVGGAPIRIDLLLIYPFLAVVTPGSLLFWLAGFIWPRRDQS